MYKLKHVSRPTGFSGTTHVLKVIHMLKYLAEWQPYRYSYAEDEGHA